MLKVKTDGGARGNPGPAASAFLVYDEKDNLIYKDAKYLGETTNNVAEYTAVLLAVNWLNENSLKIAKFKIVNFYLDSELVVKQLSGLYKIKSEALAAIAIKIKEKVRELGVKVSFNHVLRDKNKEADALVNLKLDETSQ